MNKQTRAFIKGTDRTILNAPVIMKSSKETAQYKQALQNTTSEAKVQQLTKKINMLEFTLTDAQLVLEELLHSSLPLHILQEIRIVQDNVQCLLDFVVVTRKFILLIDVKHSSHEASQETAEKHAALFNASFSNLKIPVKSVVVFTNAEINNTNLAILHVTSLIDYIKQELAKPSVSILRDRRMAEISRSIKAAHATQ